MDSGKRGAVELLQSVRIFSGLDGAALEALAAHSRRRVYPAGEALFHEGDPGYTLYVIISGRVRLQAVTAGGETVHIAQRGPGEHFGELALLDGKPRMADAVTAESTDLLMLDRGDFVQCLERHPGMALAIMAGLADRLRQAAGDLQSRQELGVLGRVAIVLVELMGSHGHPDEKGSIRIETRVPQQDLADRIGATRESVNRALSGLRSVGALASDGRTLIVTNPEKLRRYAQA